MQSAPRRPRLGHLIGVDHEVLAQDRQLRGARAAVRSSSLALEEGPVGQHRETARAARPVGARERGRVEVLPDQPLAGRGPLDLGDQAVAPAARWAVRAPAQSRAVGAAASNTFAQRSSWKAATSPGATCSRFDGRSRPGCPSSGALIFAAVVGDFNQGGRAPPAPRRSRASAPPARRPFLQRRRSPGDQGPAAPAKDHGVAERPLDDR